MNLHIRVYTDDNMFFGPSATNALVVDDQGKTIKDFGPPFARLQARIYVLFHRR